MKKTILTLLVLVIATFGFSQKVVDFTSTTANDTLSLQENQVVKLENKTGTGATLLYYNAYGSLASKDVIERAGDTTGAVGASLTFSLDFSAADTLDSITVAGTKITSVSVPFITSDSITADSIAQSINLAAGSYTATRGTGAAITITAPKANAQAFNNQSVITFSRSEATLDAVQGQLSGGVSKGRDVTLSANSDRLFIVQSGIAVSADKVRLLVKRSSGCDVWLEDDQLRVIQSTSGCKTISTALNAK